MMYFEEKPITTFTASYRDWTGTVAEWRESFFTLLSYKNSYRGFLDLTINASYDHTAYLELTIDSEKLNAEKVEDLLNDLGYKTIKYESTARFVDSFDLDDSEEFCGPWYIE